MRERAVSNEKRMRNDEADEDRKQQADRLLHAPQVEKQQHDRQADLEAQLRRAERWRKQREQRIDAARDRDRDGQHVIDDQCAPGYKSRIRS